MKRVLVAGASGYLGSFVAREFKEGDTVVQAGRVRDIGKQGHAPRRHRTDRTHPCSSPDRRTVLSSAGRERNAPAACPYLRRPASPV